MPGDERRDGGGSRLRRDHAEGLREDRGDDRDVGERQEMHEMPLMIGRRPAGDAWGAFTASAGAAVAPGATAVLTVGCGRC